MPNQSRFLYGMRLQREALSKLLRALALGEANVTQLQAIAMLLEQLETSRLRELLSIVVAEQYSEIEAARDSSSALNYLQSVYSGPPPQEWLSRIEYELSKWKTYSSSSLKLAQAELLETYCDALHVLSQSPPDFDKLQQSLRRTSPTHPSLSQSSLVAKLLISEFRGMAEVRSLRMAIACEQYRLQHGRFPVSLDELQPYYINNVLIDPFTGSPLSYRRKSRFVVIYSYGSDGVDNNGDVVGNHRIDIGFQLFDKQYRGMTYECKAALCDTVQISILIRLLMGW